MNILDPTGQPVQPLDGPIEPPPNVVPMPQPELERTARIVAKGDKRAIVLLFETKLDGARVNLLLARIYVACENAEREVMALGAKDVERVLQRFKDGLRRRAEDGEEAKSTIDRIYKELGRNGEAS